MEPGASLGPYRIDRELGSGGMGKVYAATGPEGVVALKIVHPHLLEQPGFFKRFLREADIGKSVRHDNVVRTLDCDQLVSGGQANAYLVMEYVEGQTLADLQRELDRLPEELCRHVAREICKGLAAIHAAGVVHRDLKPENVLITPDHVVKVMDLGVARLADEQMRLSQSGAFIGSVEYAAPEQFDGNDVDHRCDLHALGLLLYELSCGQHPYRADDFRTVMKLVCGEAPRRVGEVNPQLSAFFEEVVQTLLAKKREARFSDAAELLDVLEEGEDSAWWHERALALRAATKRPLRRIRIPRETAVYGREKELTLLRSLFVRAQEGEGQVVLIEGEAGIGKSRLIDEAIVQFQADGDSLNFLSGSYPPSGAAMAEGGFSTAYREQFGDAGSAPYLPETPLLVPNFDALLSGHPPSKDALQLNKDSIGTCFVHATRALAAERPTVVLIDDLHFAPDEARGLFTALALAVPGHRVLLVGTMRPGVPEDWIANVTRLDHALRLELQRLGPKDLAALLEDSFGSVQLADELGMKVVRKSDGNPFFIFEIIRGLREGQFITQKDDGTWASTRVIDEIQIPSSVLDLVNARVADLSEQDRDILDVACCWGFEFDPALVGDVLAMGRIPVLKRLGQIERKHRLVRAAGRTMVFDHHQVQEALYGSLLEQLREEYHAALAEALEKRTGAHETVPEELDGALCVDLCEHYLKGARGESALRYLRASQAHLSASYLHAHMVTLSESALAVPGLLIGAERAKVLIRMGRALDAMGRRRQQEECVREAERLAAESGDDVLLDRALTGLSTLFHRTSRPKEAEVVSRRTLALALTSGDRKAEAGARINLGLDLTAQQRLEEARETIEKGLTICRELGERGFEANAVQNLGVVFAYEGRAAEAFEQFERALSLTRALGSKIGEATAIGNLGATLALEGRYREAGEFSEQYLTLSREVGDRDAETRALASLGTALVRQGRLREAHEHLEQSIALCREIGQRRGEAFAQNHLGAILREHGDFVGSEESQLASLQLCSQIGHRRLEAATHLALGSLRAELMRAEGCDETGARAALTTARDLAAEIDDPGVVTLACCELALLPNGNAADALAALAEHGARLSPSDRQSARLLLWSATSDRAHLEEAKRLLDMALSRVSEEYHEAMLTKLRLNREILAAWQAEFGEDDSSHGGSPNESPTRAG